MFRFFLSLDVLFFIGFYRLNEVGLFELKFCIWNDA